MKKSFLFPLGFLTLIIGVYLSGPWSNAGAAIPDGSTDPLQWNKPNEFKTSDPDTVIADGGSLNVCLGDTLTLEAHTNGGINWGTGFPQNLVWSGGPTGSQQLSGADAYKYQVDTSVANTYTITCTGSKKTITVTVNVVEVESITTQNSTPNNPVEICLGVERDLVAVPNPLEATFPSGYPKWSFLSKPSSSALLDTDLVNGQSEVTISPDVEGNYDIEAKCGTSSKTIRLIVTNNFGITVVSLPNWKGKNLRDKASQNSYKATAKDCVIFQMTPQLVDANWSTTTSSVISVESGPISESLITDLMGGTAIINAVKTSDPSKTAAGSYIVLDWTMTYILTDCMNINETKSVFEFEITPNDVSLLKHEIVGDALGCTINEDNGDITTGMQVGTITVKASSPSQETEHSIVIVNPDDFETILELADFNVEWESSSIDEWLVENDLTSLNLSFALEGKALLKESVKCCNGMMSKVSLFEHKFAPKITFPVPHFLISKAVKKFVTAKVKSKVSASIFNTIIEQIDNINYSSSITRSNNTSGKTFINKNCGGETTIEDGSGLSQSASANFTASYSYTDDDLSQEILSIFISINTGFSYSLTKNSDSLIFINPSAAFDGLDVIISGNIIELPIVDYNDTPIPALSFP